MTRKNKSQRSLDRERRTSRTVLVTIGGVVVLVLLASLFFDEMGLPRYLRMLRHAQQLEQEIKDLQQATEELRSEMVRAQGDPTRLEQLARERLGYVRKGETVYQLVPSSPPITSSESAK